MRPYRTIWGIFIFGLLLAFPVRAQTPIVHGLFFYSPTCPHCHEVINNDWPAIEDEFGSQLRVLFVDVSDPVGAQIMQATRQALSIESSGVPMLVLGETVLVGSIQIPTLAPEIMRAALSADGIAPPPVVGIEALFNASEAGETLATASDERSLGDKLSGDPAGNMLALAILFGLVGSLIAGIAPILQPELAQSLTEDARWPIGIASIGGLGVAFALLAGTEGGAVTVLALVLVAVFGAVAMGGIQIKTPNWIAPIVMLAGAATAGYMFYVESGAVEAVCGMVGDCNAVQQSAYAYFAGVPIGLLGVMGYAALLLLWALGRIVPNRNADLLLLVGVLFGTAFSLYLTFLEPFVIGAVCAWCLTSALLMVLTLWTVVPLGWQALATPDTAGEPLSEPIMRQI